MTTQQIAVSKLREIKKHFAHAQKTPEDNRLIKAIGHFIGGGRTENDLRSILRNQSWCYTAEVTKQIIGRM